MFMTEQSKTLGGNLQAVYDRMVKRGLDKEYTILVSARPASYETQTRKSTKQLIRKMAQCSMIFIDDHAPIFDWLELNPRTKLIQLWHAGAGFKSSGYSRWGHLGCPAPEISENFSQKCLELMMNRFYQLECPVWMNIWIKITV